MRSTSLRSRQRRSFPHIAAESLNLRRRRLLFEPLEDRRVLAGFTFTVNSPDDNPSGPSPGIVTLRDAINALNSDSVVDSNNPDLINFAIPGSPIISLAADLPALAKPVVISGSTQAGVTVSGNGFAMVVENSGDATLEGITFTGGTVSLGARGYLSIGTAATLSASGDLHADFRSEIDNYGTLVVSGDFIGGNSVGVYAYDDSTFNVVGNFALGDGGYLYNGVDDADAATLTVGGNFTTNDFVYNYGHSTIDVGGDFTLNPYLVNGTYLNGGFLYNGLYDTDAATITVGGSFRAWDFVYQYGKSSLSVVGNGTIGSFIYNGLYATDAATITVGGNLSTDEFVYQYGKSAIDVAGNCTIGEWFQNGSYPTDATTLTVGGNFAGHEGFEQDYNGITRIAGNFSLSRLNAPAAVNNYDNSVFLVQGDFTVTGDGSQVYNGYTSGDAAIFTIGGDLSLPANSQVYTYGINPLTVVGSFILGADSHFEDFGAISVGGFFDPGSGDATHNNTIGGTFSAAPGSNVTTNISTWEVLFGGLLELKERGRFTLASGGSLIVNPGGTFTVDTGGMFIQGGTAFQNNDEHNINWAWTGHGGDGNWDNPANWNATPSPNWIGGPTNTYPGQGVIAGELDFVAIDTGLTAVTITVRTPDNLSVQALYTAANVTLAITGGTLNILASSKLRGSLAMTGGTLAVQGNRTKVEVAGATTVFGASLSAAGGATLSLPNLKSYSNEIMSNPTSFTANGADSLLNLPAVTSLGTLDSPLSLHAVAGGVVNLSALTLDGGDPHIIQDIQSGGAINNLGIITVTSSLTITEGIHTGSTYNLLPGAKLAIFGGAFGASFNVAAGASITIYAGTFDGTTFNVAAGGKADIYGGVFTGSTNWSVGLGAIVSVFGFPTASGTWTGTGLGTMQLSPARFFIENGGLNLNFAGDMLHWTDGTIDGGRGELINLGTIHLTGSDSKNFFNDSTFDNFGTIIQSGIGDFLLGTDNLFPVLLKNELGALYQIEGDGGINQVQDHNGVAFFPSIDNLGTIRKASGSGVTTFKLDGSITNTGIIEASSGTLYLNASNLPQVVGGALTSGVWNVRNGATLQLPDSANITTNAATISMDGAGASMTRLANLNTNTGSFELADGANFTTTGDFNNNGRLGIGSASTLHISGNFVQSASGAIDQQIGGTPGSGQFGQITVTQSASLAGAFNLALVNDFGPSSGQDFPVMTFASASGAFTSVTGLNPFFTQTQDATSLHLVNSSTNAVDLQLSNVAAPIAAVTGQQVTVNWTVNNPGIQAASGSWKDSVYLSTTPTITASSIFLGATLHAGGLATGQFYNGTWTGTLRGAPGSYYVVVQVDSLYQVADPSRDNNIRTAATGQINLSLPALTLDTPVHDSFTAANQDRYYQITVPAGGTLQISLVSDAVSGGTALYLSQGVLPTPYNFQAAAQLKSQPNQTVTLPQVLTGGTYYLLAHSDWGNAATAGFTLTATQTTSLIVTAISSYAGRSGSSVTIEINGANFAANASASLTPVGGGTPLYATAINFVNASKMFATFVLTGTAADSYTLKVEQGVQSATAPTTFQVLSFVASITPPKIGLITPEVVRSGRTGTFVITYSNPTSNDIIVPVLFITTTNDKALFSTSDDPNNYRSSVHVLATSPNGPAGILRPGQSGQITVTLQSNDTIDGNDIPIVVSQIEAGQTIDWAAQESSLRPPTIPTAAWHVIYGNFVALVGTTTDSYNAALAQAATYLGNLGETQTEVSSVGRLLSFLIAQADADFPIASLASAVDVALPTPGSLSLAIDRTFVSSIASRYTPGIFGLGWKTSWQAGLSVDESGNVTINNAGALSLFIRQASGGYLATEGKHGTLTLSSGIYTFSNSSGTKYAFRTNGNLNYVQDTNGNRITLGYNGNNQLIALTYSNPANPSQPTEGLTLAYNPQGFVSQVVAGTGDVWAYNYDSAGHLLSVKAPGLTAAGLTTSYSYSPVGNALASITHPDGSQQNFTYDARGRLSGTSANGGAEAVTYTYLSQAEVKTSDSAGRQTIVWYNDLGLPGQIQDVLGGISTFRYDINGNLVTYTNAAGQSYRYAYGQSGNLLQTINPLGQSVQMSYGTFGKLKSITDAASHTTQYGYDAKGNLLSITYPGSSKRSFTYDPLGNLASTVLQNGDPIDYEYNAQGLVGRKTFTDGSSQTYAYNARGNMLIAQTFDSSGTLTGTTSLTYDAANQLTSIVYPDGRSLAFTYDDTTGQRLTSIDQSGYTLTYSYDTRGRLSGLSDGTGLVVAYTYNNFGQLTKKTNGNGSNTTYAYNAAGSLTGEINYADSTGTTINSSFAYTYNNLGEVTSCTDINGNVTAYTYDAIGQLTGVSMPGQIITYAYNLAGNRTQVTVNGVPTLYTSNSENEITQVGSATYTYDTNGNLHAVTDSSGTTTYSYNDLNQLLSITASDGAVTYFNYSPLGFMVGETVNGTQTSYLVDPTGLGNVVAAYDGSGSLLAHYNYGLGLASQTGPSGTGYYDSDITGNIIGITGSSGAYVNQYSYLSFGETTTVSATLPNPFTFSGQVGVMQIGSNLFNMRSREYMPAMGQFLSNDPIGFAGGDTNIRRYVGNSPVGLNDPTGLTGYLAYYTPGVVNNPGTFTLLGVLAPTQAAFGTHAQFFFDHPTAGGYDNIGLYPANFSGNVNVLPWVAGVNYDTHQNRNDYTFYKEFAREDVLYAAITLQQSTAFVYTLLPNGTHVNGSPFDLSYLGNCQSFAAHVEQTYNFLLPIFEAAENIRNLTSHDPNAFIGPAGFGAQNFIQENGVWPYTVEFENTGSIAAQDVTVTEQLDADLDWTTFQLGSFGFGSLSVAVPAGLTKYRTVVDYQNSDGSPLNVLYTAEFNVESGLLIVTYNSLDPLSGQAPAGVFDGFLPPNDASHIGEGYVQYLVQPKVGLASGAVLNGTASIVFDTNEPIVTNIYSNTTDSLAPSSAVQALPATVNTANFAVSWSGTDNTGGVVGSGIASYDIYVSVDGAAFTWWKQFPGTTLSDTYAGVTGHTYSFYSIATDQVGLVESAKHLAETSTQVVVATYDFGDAPSSYGTLLVANGPRHLAVGPMLGASRDTEADGQPSSTANGDGADEDGVIVPSTLLARQGAKFTVTASGVGRLDAWIDFNRNGKFDDNEQIANGLVMLAGSNTFNIIVPTNMVAGQSYARFRLSSLGGLSPTGFAPDGEVEDYALNLAIPALGSAAVWNDPENPGQGVLVIRGTNNLYETINVQPTSGQTGKVTASISPGASVAGIDLASFGRIVVFGEGGIDSISIAGGITKPSVIYGDEGNDSISGGSGNDTIFGGAGSDWISGNAGDDTISGGEGSDTLAGGAGVDRLVEAGAGAITLTNSQYKFGTETNNISQFEAATLTGSASSDTFSLSGWSFPVSIDGLGGLNTVVDGGDGNFTLTETSLARTIGGATRTVALANIQNAMLTGGFGNNSFNLNGWPNMATLSGSFGTDSFSVAGDADYTLSDAILLRPGLGLLRLDSIESAALTGGEEDNTFNVGMWTKAAALNGAAGSDKVVASGNMNFTLSNTSLTRTTGGTVSLASIEQAELTGGSGNNTLNATAFSGSVKLDGGSGNDTLQSGPGIALLLGGAGNDILTAGSGRAVMIGGAGLDRLTGGSNDDLLISGQTVHDTDAAALAAILAEWTSASSYTDRVNHLTGTTGGLNNGKYLNGMNVTHDTAVDILFGGLGNDLFFAKLTNPAKDTLGDKAAGETAI